MAIRIPCQFWTGKKKAVKAAVGLFSFSSLLLLDELPCRRGSPDGRARLHESQRVPAGAHAHPGSCTRSAESGSCVSMLVPH